MTHLRQSLQILGTKSNLPLNYHLILTHKFTKMRPNYSHPPLKIPNLIPTYACTHISTYTHTHTFAYFHNFLHLSFSFFSSVGFTSMNKNWKLYIKINKSLLRTHKMYIHISLKMYNMNIDIHTFPFPFIFPHITHILFKYTL